MSYCQKCGTKLELKTLEHEGMVPFCKTCKAYRFESFSVAVSMIIVTRDLKKTLLIEQYGKKRYILVAGYVNKTEALEEAAIREISEEVGLTVKRLIYQKSKYYEKSNVLMVNYIAIVEQDVVTANYEIDSYSWFSLEEAKQQIASPSLAQEFYNYFYDRVKNNEI